MKARACLLVLALSVLAGSSLYAAGITVYPVPWVPEGGKVRFGNATDGITFSNLPADGEIFIYTVTGELVTSFRFNDPSLKAVWMGKSKDGRDAASGVYLWVVRSGDFTKTGKLIIIR